MLFKRTAYALVAQLDRVFGYEPKGQGFESLAAHHRNGIPVGMPFLFFNDILHWKDTSACSRVHGTRSAGTVGYTVFCHTRVL